VHTTQAPSQIFADPTNYDLHIKDTASSLYNAGTALSSEFSEDIDGQTRTSNWDIGADEQ
jgi:hypothetical protein